LEEEEEEEEEEEGWGCGDVAGRIRAIRQHP